MGRPKKSKLTIKESPVKAHIEELTKKRGRPNAPSHVLRLTDWLYIKADAHCWAVMEIVENNRPNGEKYPDKAILFYTTLQDAIRGAVNYGIRVPLEYIKLMEKLDDIYSLIEARIPPNVRPKDLFTDLLVEESDD